MKDIICKHCGKESFGADSRQFCKTSCRVAYWQKERRKKKLVRPKFAKLETETVEQAQFRIIASMITIREAAKRGDGIALSVLKEIDRQLTNIAKELE